MRRALGALSVLLVLAAVAYARPRPVTPLIVGQPVSLIAPTTTAAPPPTPSSVPRVVARAPARAPVPPPPPAVPALTGPFTVATATTSIVNVYSAPDGALVDQLSSVNEAGTTRVLLVKHRVDANWIEALMPTRPNGHTRFVRTSEVALGTVDTQVLVEQRYHRLTVWAGQQQIAQVPVAIGKPGSPTPNGLFYLAMLLKSPNPGGAYGPYVFGLSAHSNVYERFGGGDGMVGLHGTNQPSSVGRSASHGCLRVTNRVIDHLASALPVGTPIVIVS